MRTHYQERRALGCLVRMALVTDDPDLAERSFRRLWLEILYFEKRCSRFLPDSELSQFNKAAGTKQFVSPQLRDILQAAREMALRTDGLYNPFILPAVQRAGYVHSLEPDRDGDVVDDFSQRQVVPGDQLEIGNDWAIIPYGSAIDLGGCGKGYIGDHLSGLAAGEALQGYWFSIGGDTILGGRDGVGEPWTVQLQPDPDGGPKIGEVKMTDEGPLAVATSTTRFRRGERKGRKWHHIIDPRTGEAAESDLDLATVCGRSLLEADVLATCAIIAGSEAVRGFIEGQKDVAAAAWQAGKKAPLETWGKGIVAHAEPA